MKKILIFLFLLLNFGSVIAGTKDNLDSATSAYETAKENYENVTGGFDEAYSSYNEAKTDYENAKSAYYASEESSGDLESYSFTIDVSDISPGINIDSYDTTEEKVNFLLGTVIQKMMIALGSLSVLIMTIGGGYIILHNGQDELLSKGKSIFMSGVYAMAVALSSYYLISIVRYLLYASN